MKVSGVDRQSIDSADRELESVAPQVRPDLIGGIRVWTAPDGFVGANYFTSEHDARDGESKDPPPELAEALEDFMVMRKDAEYFDFTEPFVHSAPTAS